MNYSALTTEELSELLSVEQNRYNEYCAAGLKLDISRGKPCREQLDLSMAMLDTVTSETIFNGLDVRNYGTLDGIPQLKALIAELIEVRPEELIILGNSSLNLMYDTIQRAMQFGVYGGKPWNSIPQVKFLCPVPGYDRHFAVTEQFGIQMIAVPMDENGPVMDIVEEYVAADAAIKGIWCVPKYSNPTGIVYSDEVVDRLARMETAADDFRIMWDNAYFVHNLGTDYPLKNMLAACRQAGNPDRVFMFGSTSKITFAGAGVAFTAASENNIAYAKKFLTKQTIGGDKLSQYMHLQFLKSKENVAEHMKKHAEILIPKFRLMMDMFDTEFGADCDFFRYTKPKGGYFISVNVTKGSAKQVCELCRAAGLTITPAGATYPKGFDDSDSNLRIAPTFVGIEELEKAGKLLVCCIRISALQAILADRNV